ncbi:MAG: hypothetical protein J5482_02240 [Oscillospiraceae bacterium]|nr:hypothetical protein [Oscillospiraceae bacterium]
MAESGRIPLSVTSTNYITGWIDWLESDVNAANNTSKVTLKLTYKNAGNFQTYSASSTFYLKVDGTEVATKTDGYTMDSGNTYVVLQKEVTVTHNANGGKAITVAGGGALTGTRGLSASSGSGTATLTTIPRESTMTVPVNMTMGQEYTLSIIRASNAFTHTVGYSFGSSTGIIAQNATTTAKWTPPASLGSQIPTANSDTVTLTLNTYNGVNLVGTKTYTATLAVPDYTPTAELNISLDNSASATVAGWGIALVGYTKLAYAVTGGTSYGASITVYEVTIGGTGEILTVSSGLSGILTTANGAVCARVKDGRPGKWSEATEQTVTVYDYGAPEILNGAVFRCNAQGEATNDGAYLYVLCHGSIYSAGGYNAMTCRCRVRSVGGSWGSYTTLLDNVGAVIPAGLSATASYEAELSVIDTLGSERTVLYTIPTAAVAFHLKQGGRGAAFGKYAEHDNTLELPTGWEITIGGTPVQRAFFPVGSILQTVSGTDPTNYIGGTWTQIATSTVGGVTVVIWQRTA